MRVLGIDPGLGRCGFAVLDANGKATRAVTYGTVTTGSGPVSQRLAELATRLRTVVREFHPTVAAIEQLFVNRNTRTAMTVGQASGVALLVAAEAGLQVVGYTPSQVKLAISGSGSAPKAQIGFMVKAILGLPSLARPADSADAIAVALCHLQHSDLTSSVGTDTLGGRDQRSIEEQWLARAAPTSPSLPGGRALPLDGAPRAAPGTAAPRGAAGRSARPGRAVGGRAGRTDAPLPGRGARQLPAPVPEPGPPAMVDRSGRPAEGPPGARLALAGAPAPALVPGVAEGGPAAGAAPPWPAPAGRSPAGAPAARPLDPGPPAIVDRPPAEPSPGAVAGGGSPGVRVVGAHERRQPPAIPTPLQPGAHDPLLPPVLPPAMPAPLWPAVTDPPPTDPPVPAAPAWERPGVHDLPAPGPGLPDPLAQPGGRHLRWTPDGPGRAGARAAQDPPVPQDLLPPRDPPAVLLAPAGRPAPEPEPARAVPPAWEPPAWEPPAAAAAEPPALPDTGFAAGSAPPDTGPLRHLPWLGDDLPAGPGRPADQVPGAGAAPADPPWLRDTAPLAGIAWPSHGPAADLSPRQPRADQPESDPLAWLPDPEPRSIEPLEPRVPERLPDPGFPLVEPRAERLGDPVLPVAESRSRTEPLPDRPLPPDEPRAAEQPPPPDAGVPVVEPRADPGSRGAAGAAAWALGFGSRRRADPPADPAPDPFGWPERGEPADAGGLLARDRPPDGAPGRARDVPAAPRPGWLARLESSLDAQDLPGWGAPPAAGDAAADPRFGLFDRRPRRTGRP